MQSCGLPGHLTRDCPNKNQAASAVVDDASSPTCPTHGCPCIKRTVQKEGQNKGREFWKCPEATCNTFIWADEPNTQSQPVVGGFQNRSSATAICFRCNEPGHYASACPHPAAGSGAGRGWGRGSTPNKRGAKRFGGKKRGNF